MKVKIEHSLKCQKDGKKISIEECYKCNEYAGWYDEDNVDCLYGDEGV